MEQFLSAYKEALANGGVSSVKDAPLHALYEAVSQAAMQTAAPAWNAPRAGKAACYFSAEFLIGRVVYANLFNLGLLDGLRASFLREGVDCNVFEAVDDDALGNGGLGRLAACFLDSAATLGKRLDGFGIRYKYGLFKQKIENGFQTEYPDDWQRFGDPWSIRRDGERVQVAFGDSRVWAVPYDMPVIGYGGQTVNTLRLWQAEADGGFDLAAFNAQRYSDAFLARNEAAAIHSVLYPNDDTDAGKRLRIKQQYFFSSASVQSILRAFKRAGETDFAKLPQHYAVQLNDTHPVVAIPELIRLLVQNECLCFEDAFAIARQVFSYTNHTIMAEALEAWDTGLFSSVVPDVYPYVVMVNDRLRRELSQGGVADGARRGYEIVADGRVHMARMAVYATHATNGVAAIHSEILKNDVFKNWYALYPERFSNKTNGVTPRRWLALANPGLAGFITARIGDGWVRNLDELARLRPYADDDASLLELAGIKVANKREFASFAAKHAGAALSADSVFDVQAKRIHEYKRQLLNAFSIMELYFRVKDGELPDIEPVTFLFGGKSAPGYRRAKGIIKYITEVAKKLRADPAVRDKISVLFVPNYNVSVAEKLMPAADISEQISTAGTEASGTGNMKLMMNGAVTLGTWDGANIEIVQAAGAENNYIFGARVEELHAAAADYSPYDICMKDARIRRVVDTLVDGTLDDGGTGAFAELHHALLHGESWHRPDNYYLLLDLPGYVDTKLRALADTRDRKAFSRKCLLNIAASGCFSSDRTIEQYAEEIWNI